jgi:hypothetical protein
MTEKIRLVRGDTRPAIVCTLTNQVDGTPIVIGGSTIRLKFREAGADQLTATVVGVITDPLNGQVVFYPSSAPEMLQNSAGDYEGEIEITFQDGTVQTVFDLLKFRVREDF